MLGAVFNAPAAQARDIQVPEALRPWKAWVADQHPQWGCPEHEEAGAICVTYGSLKLDLGETGGSFIQSVIVFGKQWVGLPGNSDAWPQNVREGASVLPVVLRAGLPQVQLTPGEHEISGTFAWNKLPQSLQVPSSSALMTLRLKGKPVAVPEMSGDGNLQLGAPTRVDTTGEEAPLTLRVYRKLMDGIPMRLETYLTVSVSGRDREILTGRFLPEGSAVLSIQSDIPLRITPEGRLRAQLRAGDHAIRVVSRFLEPVVKTGMAPLDSLWPQEEIWSFEAQRDLRVVELTGATLIDPSQWAMPAEWKSLPAYRLTARDTLRLEEKQRGNPVPVANDLRLIRDLWLDFSGKGMTVRDGLSGSLPARSRLEMEGGFRLGRVEAMGEPVMITSLKNHAGVEMPAGSLSVLALSRFDRGQGAIPATGWNQDFQGVQATLHLPPGWKLIHAEGPDSVGQSWITDWSLWDVFLLCILTLGVLRLAGWVPAVVALICFVLLSQEDGISGLLWLNLLAAMGLWKVLPEGKLRRWANGYRLVSFAVLAAIWIPFAIVHARKALYPQLDGPGSTSFRNSNYNMLDLAGGYGYSSDHSGMQEKEAPMVMPMPMPQNAPPMEQAEAGDAQLKSAGRVSKGLGAGYPRKARQNRFNDNASKVQSGPGEPAWGWESAGLFWSGPVPAGEKLTLIMARPWLTRILRALQALLPGVLLLMLAFPAARAMRSGDGGGTGPAGSTGANRNIFVTLLLAAGSVLAPAGAVRAGDFPPDNLLQQLAERMSAPRDCAPSCAEMNGGRLEVKGDRLVLNLIFDAADTAFAALPKPGEGQFAWEAIRLGGKPAAGAIKLSNGSLAIALPRGRHAVTLEGRILGPRLELNFGDKARNLKVQAAEYSVQGLISGRTENGALVLQRREAPTATHSGPELTPDPIPPFVQVIRNLVLDQEWMLETRVVRIAPETGAFTVEVPLLPFEHPTSSGMAETRGTAMVSLQEGQPETGWRSAVDRSAVLTWVAGNLSQRAETWSVEASSRWHIESSGLSPMLPPGGQGGPQWKPLPGDSLALVISEPQAASGAVKTIESAALTVQPGKRETAGSLNLTVRAGQGDVTRVELPPAARLEFLRLDGVEQPLTQRKGALAIPLHPGIQNVQLAWKQPEGISVLQKSPQVKLGDEAANLSLQIEMPGDRWVLWVGGNAIGPALLLWGVLAVLTGIAWLLGRARITPLGFVDWALLFLGTSMVNVYATAPLLALFLTLRYREKHAASWKPKRHNLFQIAAAGLAILAFGMLLAAVPEGLLSSPDMQVTGNGSYAGVLRWFQDRAQGAFPTGWVLSLPMWVYRLAMLAWSLWLARRLLQWLRWSWEKFAVGGIWREAPKQPVPPKA